MADLSLEWRSGRIPPDGTGDLSLTPAGDLAMSDGDVMVQQHILRRLFTSLKGYIWHPEYGAGLPHRIGRTAKARDIESLVRSNIFLEATVAKNPPPVITVTEGFGGVFVIAIKYFDNATGAPVALNFEVPAN